MKAFAILILMTLLGCSSFGKTVAGGADGQVDYDACISFMGNELACIKLKAARNVGEDT